jgi:tetrathionate reductase subunit B
MTKRYAMVIDLRKCVGCSACAVACRSQWNVEDYGSRTWVENTGIVGDFPNLYQTNYVGQCNHCDDATCLNECPTEATQRDKNGIIWVDSEVCIGCGLCLDGCPYGARYINHKLKKVDKCDFCRPRLDQGLQPVCVQTCISGAKTFGDLSDPKSEVYDLVYKQGAGRIPTPGIDLGANLYYLGEQKHIDLIAAKFPVSYPDGSKMKAVWKFLKPALLGAAALTFTGQAIAMSFQLSKNEDTHID